MFADSVPLHHNRSKSYRKLYIIEIDGEQCSNLCVCVSLCVCILNDVEDGNSGVKVWRPQSVAGHDDVLGLWPWGIADKSIMIVHRE